MPCNSFTVMINNENVTKYTQFPIKWENALDERLDTARISLKQFPKSIIQPMSPAVITVTDKEEKTLSLRAIITTDEAIEVPVGSGLYDHEIFMLEETKILEGIVVDTLVFTNPLGKDYTLASKKINPDMEINSIIDYTCTPIRYISPLSDNTEFTFCSLKDMFNGYGAPIGKYRPAIQSDEPSFIPPSGIYVRYNDKEIARVNFQISDNWQNDTITLNLQSGIYEVTYIIWNYQTHGGKVTNYTKATFTFNVIKDYNVITDWNIATVIDRVLDLAETHIEGIKPRFKLNGKDENGEQHIGQYAEFEKIKAPEFAFTNCTLKEILDQIGGYIHGIPRLYGDEIFFDMLGGTEQASLYEMNYPYISNLYTQDIENYCTSLDSTVENLVCLVDSEQGTITEPCLNGSKSVRSEIAFARLEEDNMVISTQYPIQEIVSVVNTSVPDMSLGEINITSYIYEEADYNRMSSYTDIPPEYTYVSSKSKVYALYYKQGNKNIYGLNFKQIQLNGEVQSVYAISKILSHASKKGIDDFKKVTRYQEFAFRVSYIPIFSARTQQTKQCINGFIQPRTLVYNQNANLIETSYYGENLKGIVARMGNVERVVTYNLDYVSLIPKIGQLYGDDYYISSVVCEVLPAYIKCVVSLSQDFNRLSQYIGINTVRRFYEVSEKQAYKRDIKYSDYVVIGDKVDEDETILNNITFMFDCLRVGIGGNNVGYTSNNNPTCAIIQGYNTYGIKIEDAIVLPLITTAQGNAAVFHFSYDDNYSAGFQVKKEIGENTTGYFINSVPYSDYFGRIDTIKFIMTSSIPNSDPLLLPQCVFPADQYGHMFQTNEHGIVVRKDSAEILSFNYIVEFVTNRKNYIIGSGLARWSSLVASDYIQKKSAPALYILPTRLSKFKNEINLNNAVKIWDFCGNGNNMQNTHISLQHGAKSIKFEDFISNIEGKAWAIVFPWGELLFGANETIIPNNKVNMPYMTLKHNIFNL